jgi:hypothetical protein
LDGDAIGASHFLPPMLGNALEGPYIPVTVNRIILLSATFFVTKQLSTSFEYNFSCVVWAIIEVASALLQRHTMSHLFHS